MLTRWISCSLLLLLPVCGAQAPAFAALDRWEQIGPEGGSIVALVLDPSDSRIVYANAGPGGIFKSTDGGGSWSPASDGLAPRQALNLVIDPRSPQTLYAAALGGGVFKSTDGAQTWQNAGAGLPERGTRRTVAFDPGEPSTLYASVDAELFKSTDAAATWSRLAFESGQDVAALAVDPVHRTVLAGSDTGDIFRSTDGGATWARTLEGTSYLPVQGFAFHPTGLAVYAVASNRLLRSADGGVSWQPAGRVGLPSLLVTAVAVHPATPRILYLGLLGDTAQDGSPLPGGVFRSGDQGRTWTEVRRGLETDGITALAIDPARPATLYAGDKGNGVFKSTDAAGRWSAANRGLRAVDLVNVEIDPKRPRTIFAGSPYGLFKTLDGGATWRKIQDLRVIPTGLALDPVRTFNLYLQSGNGLFKSSDGGATFRPLANSGGVVAVDPRDHATVYLGGYQRISKSTDGGRTWNTEGGGFPCFSASALLFPAGPSNRVLAGGSPVCHRETGGGVLSSQDAGRNWRSVTVHPLYVSALGSDPADPDTIYASGLSGLPFFPETYKSTDGGATWSFLPGLGQRAQSFASLRQPDTLYAATGAGVFETRDGGLAWSPFNEGFASLDIRELAAAPGSDSTLYAATGGGLFRRTRGF